MLICPACNKFTQNLIQHHWYEMPNMDIHSKMICQSCNSLLITKNFYGANFYNDHKHSIHHILPSWDIQIDYINNYYTNLKKPLLGKREFIYKTTLDILEKYRTHYRETYNDLIINLYKELCSCKSEEK